MMLCGFQIVLKYLLGRMLDVMRISTRIPMVRRMPRLSYFVTKNMTSEKLG